MSDEEYSDIDGLETQHGHVLSNQNDALLCFTLTFLR